MIRTDAGLDIGDAVGLEMTVEFRREVARARIVETPFYNPTWKRR
jgi:hypothetical protein